MSALDNTHSLFTSVIRGTSGMAVKRDRLGPRPEKVLELYEFESCPFCRKVRETMSELDLEYVSHTTPQGSASRGELQRRGGKVQVPYLVDPNTGTEMYETEDIIDYLHEKYGSGRSGLGRALAPLGLAGSALASAVRPRGRRTRVPRAQQPEKMLQLYNFEASPYCRKVREALNELDLDYHVKNVAKRSQRRPELVERGGKMMVPYLVDANTGTAMYESDDIVAYLRSTYGAM
jgi:glutathione S-transferase